MLHSLFHGDENKSLNFTKLILQWLAITSIHSVKVGFTTFTSWALVIYLFCKMSRHTVPSVHVCSHICKMIHCGSNVATSLGQRLVLAHTQFRRLWIWGQEDTEGDCNPSGTMSIKLTMSAQKTHIQTSVEKKTTWCRAMEICYKPFSLDPWQQWKKSNKTQVEKDTTTDYKCLLAPPTGWVARRKSC